MIHTLHLQTKERDEMIEITRLVHDLLKQEGLEDGTAVIYCPHTTAGITIQENADPDVKHDVLMRLSEVFPWEHPKYKHAEGNTASHLKAMTTGSSQTVLIAGSRLVLGRWQGIYFCEFDGPRQRTCLVKFSRG
ncbi:MULTISPECIES: secondary thiamine-phosphate synthase enzyme YjbQ [unclassified Paenibacillus]|uniref:secondary thiamine-phosphate synthase enzyme YjbQ n=1 Tax=unclassified Paenibacillus TaxID=185978 RepID=UPI001AE91754|nr:MULTISPECIES: secondary thiamine-phosphate synthase enzyme YjbQ [unclassified Paenibacillus]MBP1157427.1 secondary thiamine-phosphate synthase enzyme [Paenibacillus sp. PvP091]MBP1171835.1 secondary thiamine-phosphate synthase enzyme [Paenibacillus sp. PvR098]MBP2438216.1 secondary thiamine-phosphate synthase enzyme [Paenibacillus sp. PvP052]